MKMKKCFFKKLRSLKILSLIIPIFFISIQASEKYSYQAKEMSGWEIKPVAATNSVRGEQTQAKITKTSEEALSYQFQPAEIEKIKEAKNFMKKGVDSWDPEWLKKAREEFLGLLTKRNQDNLYLLYYVALSDYRLANYFLSSSETDKVAPYLKEGQKCLEKAMQIAPDFGELDAIYSLLLAFEINLDQGKARSLGFQIYQYMNRGLEKSPDNPRVQYLKGVSDLFTPQQYGGGPSAAIKHLSRSLELFKKEDVEDPVKPSWGEDEAYTFLGVACTQTGEIEKAREAFKSALKINPEFGMAKNELEKLEKK